ncbi:MAG: tol-pal system protein YbgF [Arsenophonus sp.]
MNSKFRYLYLSLSLLIGAIFSAVSIANAPIIHIESGSMNERLIQIEKIVNSQGQLVYQIHRQLLDTQLDIDILRGQIQENQHQLHQITERQKDLYIQLDSLMINSNKVKINNEINNTNNTSSSNKLSNEKIEYDHAVELAITSKSKQQISKAISYFQNFIKIYPKSNYQSNANYWLGQLNYNQGNKDNAAFYFATVVKNHPNSQKSAESLYKVGLLMQEKGRNDKARVVYQQVIKIYPTSSSAKLAKKKLLFL